MTVAAGSRFALLLKTAAPVAIALAGTTVLLFFPPTEYSFYPQCPVYHYFHILCPGCGATRALAALLHGQIVEALHLNMLTTLLTPAAMITMAACCRGVLKSQSFSWPQPSRSAVYVTLAAALLFTLVRNL